MFNLFSSSRLQKIFIFCLSVIFSSLVYAEQKPHAPESIPDVTVVTAEEAIDLIINNPDLVVIDSRKKTEYLKGHIEGAINILNTSLTRDDLERVSPGDSKDILFYCNGTRCLRSSDSIKKAKGWGYTRLIWFRGGWKEWTEKRLPVVTD